MTRTTKYTTLGLLATLATTVSSPVLADQQGDKNNLRNLAIAGAAVAGYGLFTHNNTATLLGAAGAAIAGSQYEQVRQRQSQDNGYYGGGNYDGRNGGQRYHRTYNNGNGAGYYNSGGSYNNSGSQWRGDDRFQDNRSQDNRDRGQGGWNGDARRDDRNGDGQRHDWAGRADQRHDDRR